MIMSRVEARIRTKLDRIRDHHWSRKNSTLWNGVAVIKSGTWAKYCNVSLKSTVGPERGLKIESERED